MSDDESPVKKKPADKMQEEEPAPPQTKKAKKIKKPQEVNLIESE
jgi:hypothetical protein